MDIGMDLLHENAFPPSHETATSNIEVVLCIILSATLFGNTSLGGFSDMIRNT